ncbi:MAG: hypothetical protein JJ975_00540 [Bacteroidia bacterium]|nr:hypothetical protein [Bacteroidia bacterium]
MTDLLGDVSAFTPKHLPYLIGYSKRFSEWLYKTTVPIMRLAIVLVCLFLFSTGFAQINTKVVNKDSLQEQTLKNIELQKEQLIDQYGKSHELLSKKSDSIAYAVNRHKDSLRHRTNAGLNSAKNQINDFRDSLLRASLNEILPKKSSLKNHGDSLNGLFRLSLDRTKQIVSSRISLSGEIVSESFVTNYQDPFTISEKAYSRFYGNPTIQVANLPFAVDFFVTTEDNTIYNSNSFRVRFDTETFKSNLQQKARDELQKVYQKKNIAREKQSELGSYKNQIKLQLDHKKSQLDQIDIQAKKNLNRHLDVPNAQDELNPNGKADQIKKGKDRQINLIENAIKRTSDSLLNPYNHITTERAAKLDSTKYETYLKRKEQYEDLKRKYELVDSVYRLVNDLDSAYGSRIEYLQSQFANPDFIKQRAAQKLGSKKLAGILSNVDYFEVGINYPFFSKLSLNGTPVKGLNAGFTKGKNHFKLVGGRTFNNRINTFGLGQPNPEFTRNVQGVYYERMSSRGSLTISNTSIWDPVTLTEPKRNFVQTLEVRRKLGKHLNIRATTAHSAYVDNRKLPEPSSETKHPGVIVQRLNRMALKLEFKVQIDAQSKMSITNHRIYPGFINLSNPFMRNGYDEHRIQLDRKFLKRRLQTSVFYKHFADNITSIQQTTNTMKGYGISARTNLKKWPNLFVQHAPYEQGNNHPDSVFRVNNQLSVTTAGIIYVKKVKKTRVSVVSNYTRSQIDFNQGEAPVENEFYNLLLALKSPGLRASVNAYRNQSKPQIDTLNYRGVRIEVGQQSEKKVNVSSSIFFDYYDSHDLRYNWVTTASFHPLQKLSIQTSFGLGMIEGLYGVERKHVYSGRLLLKYRL